MKHVEEPSGVCDDPGGPPPSSGDESRLAYPVIHGLSSEPETSAGAYR